MEQATKTKWVKALRSGKYRQKRDELYDAGAYCCLGVLARIKGASFKRVNEDYEAFVDGKMVSLKGRGILKPGFAGLSEKTQERLVRLNDGDVCVNVEPHSFKQIADYIEKKIGSR